MVSTRQLGMVAAACLVGMGHAQAALWSTDASGTLTGCRSSSSTVCAGGVNATQAWSNGGFKIDWTISQTGSLWTYNYTVDVTDSPTKIKDVSHFILEVTNDANPFHILGGTSTPTEGPKTWTASGNPGMPNPMYGVKFDFGGPVVNYTMVTDRAPVWGVFYSKDGKDGGQDVTAWSAALNDVNYKTSNSFSELDFIVRPDGGSGGGSGNPVPVPAAAWLLGSALIGLLSTAKRRRQS